MNSGYIYKITNPLDGKIYIGQTTERNPNRRINRHFHKQKSIDLVYRAVLKYGKDIFQREILLYCFDLDSLNKMEQYFINYYNSLAPNGYNIKLGGEQGGRLSEETKKKISEKNTKYYETHDHPLKGKKFTKEHCENLSKVRKGFTSPARQKVHKETIEKLKIPIKAINIKTSEEYIFDSIKECCNKLNLVHQCVSRTARGEQGRKQHKGYRFEFIKKEAEKK